MDAYREANAAGCAAHWHAPHVASLSVTPHWRTLLGQADAGMAGGGADLAALLRLYMRFGCLNDALALAHAHISAWLMQACSLVAGRLALALK